jgi:hypothetical protein
MPVHDWTRVEDGIYHDFHNVWLAELRTALNSGLLPPDFYALTEQHAGRGIADVLTLHAGPHEGPLPPIQGAVAVAEAPPRVRHTMTFSAPKPNGRRRRRTLVIRHVSGHRVVALLEIVSPSNKDRPRHVTAFARKVVGALRAGVHVLLVDIIRPGLHDPQGMHAVVSEWLDDEAELYHLPHGEPLTLASYAADRQPKAYFEHMAVGAALPEMPLFLDPERYVQVPLEPTYQAAYRGVPAFWRAVLEGGPG